MNDEKRLISASLTKQKTLKEAFTMEKWECTVCGYIYDPAEEDNVPFEDLPDDWTCPVCGVGKEEFELVEE